MDIDLKPIADAAVGLAADAMKLLGATLMAAILAMGPRIWRYLGSAIHGTDVMLIKGAIRTAAINAARSPAPDPILDDTLDVMVAYVKRTVGRIVTKLKMSDDTLRDMCAAALAEAIDAYQAAQAAGPTS